MTIRAGRRAAARPAVRRNRLVPCTRARALGWPNREENPAARTTIFNLGADAFIVIMLSMNSRVNLQHRPFLTPIWLTVGAAGVAFLFALFLIWVWGTAGSTTVIVIPVDPKLTAAAGEEERAALLARMFGGTEGPGRLDAIYASSTPNSRLIAAPLAARLRIPLSYTAESDAKAVARRALHEHRGGRVLILAHLDAFPGIVGALSGVAYDAKLDAEEYRVIDIVTVPRIGHANLLRLNY
jgi:hypothetical protein